MPTCQICKTNFDVTTLQGRKTTCSDQCRKIFRRRYIQQYMRIYRKFNPKLYGASQENFCNLALTPDGRVKAAVQLEKAIKKCKTQEAWLTA